MTELSPAAQAVLDAWNEKLMPDVTCLTHDPEREALAAALRAVVDRVIPMTKSPWGSTLVPVLSAEESRKRLLAIADELEGQ
jgi:hypothetical protein